MSQIKSIQLKASFLLFIFSLNMLVGFACGMGADMVSNSDHHTDAVVEKLQHGDEQHSGGGNHSHSSHKIPDHKKEKKGGCCKDGVVKISQADKSLPSSQKIIKGFFVSPDVVLYPVYHFTQHNANFSEEHYFVRGNHPPGRDILISIQQFRI